MQLRRSSIARGSLLALAMSLVLAACGGSGGTTGQVASQAPSTAASATPATTSADPLEGAWRNESTCQDSLRALRHRLSDKKALEAAGAAGAKGWKEFLEPWGGEPTRDDPCQGATGTRALVARFADGNLTLCEPKTGGCDVHATYKLVGDHSFTINDPSGNLCPCPEPWHFEIAGDRLTIHVEPADPWTVSTWEAAPWTRES